MNVKLKALSIKSMDYGDNGKLVTLITRERGKITAKAIGCKSIKSPLHIASSPFCFGEYIFNEKNGKLSLSGCDVEKFYGEIGEDLDRFYFASIISETLDKFCQEGQPDEEILDLTVNYLNLISNSNQSAIYVISFLLKILEKEGYEMFFAWEKEPYLDFIKGGIVEKCDKTQSSVSVSIEMAKLFFDLSTQEELEDNLDLEINATLVKESLKNLARYVYYVCGHSLYTIKNILVM